MSLCRSYCGSGGSRESWRSLEIQVFVGMLCSCPRSFDEVPLDDHNFATISESYSTWPSENGRASEATVLVSRIEEALERAQNFMDVLETWLRLTNWKRKSSGGRSEGLVLVVKASKFQVLRLIFSFLLIFTKPFESFLAQMILRKESSILWNANPRAQVHLHREALAMNPAEAWTWELWERSEWLFGFLILNIFKWHCDRTLVIFSASRYGHIDIILSKWLLSCKLVSENVRSPKLWTISNPSQPWTKRLRHRRMLMLFNVVQKICRICKQIAGEMSSE